MTEEQKKHLFPAILGVLAILFIAKSMWENYEVGERGVFVIGKWYEMKSGGSRLASSVYHYYLHGKEYNYIIGDGGDGDSLIFLGVLPDNPKTCRKIDKMVPTCLTLNDVPKEGWKKLPLDACR